MRRAFYIPPTTVFEIPCPSLLLNYRTRKARLSCTALELGDGPYGNGRPANRMFLSNGREIRWLVANRHERAEWPYIIIILKNLDRMPSNKHDLYD